MDGVSNEMLFYGGIGLAAFAVLLAVVIVIIALIRKMRLNAVLDAEYGPKPKHGR